MNGYIKGIMLVGLLVVCGCGGNDLRCGTSGDGGSFVDLKKIPRDDISGQIRYFGELCGFGKAEIGDVR